MLDLAVGVIIGAAREDGFIGVGIHKVSEGEQMAVAALALGLPE